MKNGDILKNLGSQLFDVKFVETVYISVLFFVLFFFNYVCLFCIEILILFISKAYMHVIIYQQCSAMFLFVYFFLVILIFLQSIFVENLAGYFTCFGRSKKLCKLLFWSQFHYYFFLFIYFFFFNQRCLSISFKFVVKFVSNIS